MNFENNHLYDDTATILRDSIEEFATREILPIAGAIDEDNKFPDQLWKKLGDLGLLGITVEEEFGGSGLGYFEHAIAMSEISRASASVGLSYAAHSNLCINQIKLNGTKEQKLKYLPKLIQGENVGALAMTEANAGSDIMGMHTTATLNNDHYILNGAKIWITNGPTADVLVIYARSDQDENNKLLSAFIVEKTFSGFSVGQKFDKLGMRGSDTSEIVLNNCIVPKENLLGTLHKGTRVLMSGLDFERLILAAGPVGIMQNCLDIAIPYIHERKQFGQAIGTFQLIQGKIADMYATYSACSAYLLNTAKSADHGSLTRKDAAAVILFTSERATQMALQTIQILGGNGYSNESSAGRLLRDAKLYEIGAGTSEIRRMLIGREIFNETE